MDKKQHILDEIKRIAKMDGGKPPGHKRFYQETGLKESDWSGKYWARWGDAVRESGLAPNQMNSARDKNELIERFIELMRELGKFPTSIEVNMKARRTPGFPWHKTLATRFGNVNELTELIRKYAQKNSDYSDVLKLLPDSGDIPEEELSPSSDAKTKEGFVYMGLLKIGREKRYKIGKADLVGRRTDQISIQLPEDMELIHTIKTDDAYGIESYWHRRFAAKNTKGEWFNLSREDIQAFKKRKFM